MIVLCLSFIFSKLLNDIVFILVQMLVHLSMLPYKIHIPFDSV